ncbi:putative lipoprotein YehR precursor [Jeotgalicoccus aerolatus]|uniref:Uncharacterized lipoprotein YehR (DUF1307 family) n=1 Tax=Jeotgalicoccus aerolatus TaxID=709510 RepID=A0A1G9ALD4_9STAP|nr:DUF1307 domain-containing protein [Jeotgalicoccus aerolatus]MBP1952936.1 uncharacterized lipoprotein YehR (DUF1307 family) [Jeotgalicoccus aerolatus]NMA81854.1 DUF1307 domain-containing protein [Jeotgalicoccus aerolatus]CAD2073190.1 putative lipoprotein YehR precursor [Jeotgalicoccus aerolatus]SDK28098.1 Uncharacterized lipoprotein YehR, DUF1307 family [Jeotgalicoccus aerolatus]GGE01247.1 hypothetical protein GCM10007273_12120 [Jeotgalicoccus aerolatus]
MRKAWALFLFAAVMIVLTACGSNEETRTFEMSDQGIESTLVYTHDDDKVISQSTENIINYEELGMDKAQAEEMFGSMAEQYEGLSGVEHSFEFGDEEATETLTIVYDEVDSEELEGVQGMNFEGEGDPSEGVSMERSAEMLEQQGYTEVEE